MRWILGTWIIVALVLFTFLPLADSVQAQGPADVPRLEGRIDRLNDRLTQTEQALDSMREDVYGRDGILVVLGRHESQIGDLRSADSARNTVILGAAASIGMNLLLVFLQTYLRRRNGAAH